MAVADRGDELVGVRQGFGQCFAYVPGAHLLEYDRATERVVAEARQIEPCRPPSTVRKTAVADAKATMASAEVRLDVPRVPERWNNRHNRNMFIVRLRR